MPKHFPPKPSRLDKDLKTLAEYGQRTSQVEPLVSQLLDLLVPETWRNHEGLADTPKRVAKAYEEMFAGYSMDLRDIITTFDADGTDEMIVCENIEFYSTCEHHMIPFHGHATVAYVPQDKIIGLSKMGRVVDMFAKRLQVQERLTQQVNEALMRSLKPRGVAVLVRAKHLCMCARGVRKQNSIMTTSSLDGIFKTDPTTRAEFMTIAANTRRRGN